MHHKMKQYHIMQAASSRKFGQPGPAKVNFGVAASVEVGPEPEADSTSTTASGEDGDAEGAAGSGLM